MVNLYYSRTEDNDSSGFESRLRAIISNYDSQDMFPDMDCYEIEGCTSSLLDQRVFQIGDKGMLRYFFTNFEDQGLFSQVSLGRFDEDSSQYKSLVKDLEAIGFSRD